MKRVVAAMALVVGTGAPGLAQQEEMTTGRVEVSGEGAVSVAPDLATIRLGVVADADTAGDAMAALSEDLGPVIEALTEAGIAPSDIQTGTLRLSPVYADRDPGGPDEAPRVTGYRAESLVQAVVREISGLGEVLDTAVETGANRLEGVSFSLADPQAQEDAALSAAVAEAMRKAALMAEAGGLTLGPVVSLVEAGGGGGPMPMMEMRAASDSVPVSPGEIEISSRVTMQFELLTDETAR